MKAVKDSQALSKPLWFQFLTKKKEAQHYTQPFEQVANKAGGNIKIVHNLSGVKGRSFSTIKDQ